MVNGQGRIELVKFYPALPLFVVERYLAKIRTSFILLSPRRESRFVLLVSNTYFFLIIIRIGFPRKDAASSDGY